MKGRGSRRSCSCRLGPRVGRHRVHEGEHDVEEAQ